MRAIVERIKEIAAKYDWLECDHQENIFMISFKKGSDRANVYYSKMTVATAINHPQKGKTQMYRKNVNFQLMDKIFENPRIHTSKGYREKGR